MALSADQRAMLELLLGRGQSYDDLSSLLGTPADEVRSKARWALAELGGADPDRNVALTDYLLGQADPIGRADAVRHLRDDAADRELAERLQASLREIAPGAELPSLPSEGRTAPHLRAPSLPGRPAKDGKPKPAREPMDPARTRLLMLLGGAGIILVIVVLAIAGVFSGGSDNGGVDTIANASSTTGGTTSTTPTQADPNSVPVPLKAVGGSPGSGLATLQLQQQTLSLDLQIKDLPPPPSGSVYVVWLQLGTKGNNGYPVAPLTPYPQSGSFHQVFPLPQAINPFLTSLTSIEVTVLGQQSATTLARQIQALVTNPKKGKLVFPIKDQTVLRAAVPRGKAPSGTGSGSGSGK